jgi:hypothetical protein
MKIEIGKNVTDIMRLGCVYSCHKDGDGALVYLLYDWDADGNYVEAREGDVLVCEDGCWSIERKKV